MKADPKADAAPAPKSSKKMMIIIIAAVLLLGGGGAGAWFFMHNSAPAEHGKKKEAHKSAVKPETVVIESFTVNLQPENGEPSLLQTQFTLEVAGLEQVEIFKNNMARVRNRVLLLLSAKKASELNTVAGKTQLSKELIAALNDPFVPKGEPQEVTDVLFTSFIIQ
jgi:flagellar FliL protein